MGCTWFSVRDLLPTDLFITSCLLLLFSIKPTVRKQVLFMPCQASSPLKVEPVPSGTRRLGSCDDTGQSHASFPIALRRVSFCFGPDLTFFQTNSWLQGERQCRARELTCSDRDKSDTSATARSSREGSRNQLAGLMADATSIRASGRSRDREIDWRLEQSTLSPGSPTLGWFSFVVFEIFQEKV